MPRPASDKKQRLTTAATTLTLTQGFERTSIADIARSADVPSGSVYYYFKTKEDVGNAIIDALLAENRTLMAEWDGGSGPRERLLAYIDSSAGATEALVAYGSPATVLAADLRRHSDDLGVAASAVLQELIDWAAGQFEQLGFSTEAAGARAMHLVAGFEGGAALSHTLGTTAPIEREAAHLRRWVENTKTQ
ncbi:TetR/AcrR family transcriptional regulator [Demequina aurantiaca]|uniref:TetR/AcrR family transcriptional regulator n=1 Tax=Demequina aurantiaca TaxID=676200 RepID=UPI000785E712|nr:TetR/AcrR family transcriptional regulator [Demequina aurantiaca]